MADERLRELEREARAGGDPELLDRLIREQLRAQAGRFYDVTRSLERLHAFELPVMREGLWAVGGALLRDLGAPWRALATDVHRLLDAYVTQVFPARFPTPMVFRAATGRPRREHPDEASMTLEEYERAEEEDWEHFGAPQPWTDLSFPGVVRGPSHFHHEAVACASPAEFAAGLLRWSINSKLYALERPDGGVVRVPYSSDRRELAEIERQELDHQERLAALVEAFLDGLSDEAVFCTTVHLLDPASAEANGWDLFRDEVVAAVDHEHLRVAWAGHDRYYG